MSNDTLNPTEPVFAWPTVVAVVVTQNPSEWLEKCLLSLAEQNYPDLTTLVVDVQSDEDLTERVASAMPKAFVRRVDRDINFAQAVNEAVNSIEGATYVLVCHDDVTIGPGAIEAMVEEAFRSNASIVGPKVIDADHPDQLLEVGGMIDHFGVPFTGIEKGEVDQGQHDGVRDVFYVSSAAMLVRADLFRALEGFDEQCFPGAEDIDLAWRARLVNARVLVQPLAVVSHAKTSDRERADRSSAVPLIARHRMRAVLKNSSRTSLAWIIPLAFVLHTLEGIAWLVRANPKRSWLLFSGWIWNIKNISDIRSARSRVQKTREISDRTLSTYQISGSSRIRRFFASLIENRQLRNLTVASRSFAKNKYSQRTRETPYYIAAGMIYLLGVRTLLTEGITHIGGFVRWPSVSVQMSALLHGGLPSNGNASVSSTLGRCIALVATLVTGGHPALASTLVTLSLIPLAVVGMRLLLRDRALGARSVACASIGYGASASALHIFSYGNFSSLVLLAGLPFFLHALGNRTGRYAGIIAAVMIALSAPALIVCAILSIGFILCGERTRIGTFTFSLSKDVMKRIRTVMYAAVVAAVLNIGLVIDSVRHLDRNVLGVTNVTTNFSEYFFHNAVMTYSVCASFALAVCALFVGRTARTEELRIVTVAATLIVVGTIFATRYAQPIFNEGVLYVLVAFMGALSLGVCVHSYSDEMRTRSFGIMHGATALAVLVFLLISLAGIRVIPDGRLSLPARKWVDQIETQANSRILMFGDASLLPGRAVTAPYDRTFSLNERFGSSLSVGLVGPASGLDEDIRNIYSSLMKGETSHAGYLFARYGIGSITVLTSRAPDTKLFSSDQVLLAALDRQSDLVRERNREGMVVYRNSAMTRPLTLTQYRESFDPARVFALRNGESSRLTTVKSLPSSPWSLGVLALTVLWIAIVMLWPRRHALLSQRSLNLSAQSGEGKEALDLEHEHARDRIEERATKHTLDVPSSAEVPL